MHPGLKGRFFAALALVAMSLVAQAQGVAIESAQVRMVPPGQAVTAAFFTLKNLGSSERVLTAAYCRVAATVEIHQHITQDGIMKMRRLSQLQIPGGAEIEFKPGGFHLMLIGLDRSLVLNEIIDLELEFENGERVAFSATVQMVGAH